MEIQKTMIMLCDATQCIINISSDWHACCIILQ